MAFTVEDARKILSTCVLHTYEEALEREKYDRAIIAAGNRFLRETRVARSVKSWSISSGTNTYDLDSAISSEFRPDQIIGLPHLQSTDWRPLQIVDYEVIRREYDASAASGRPEMVGFHGDTAIVFPDPDANYTITVNSWDLLTTTNWTIGGTDATTLAVTLNIPERWCYGVIWWGARAYLLYGAPGHPDDQPAMGEFLNVIERAKGEGQRSGKTWPSYKGTIEQAYGPRPRL